jgi:hypothetical protein
LLYNTKSKIVNKIGQILSIEYEITKKGNYATFDTLQKAIEVHQKTAFEYLGCSKKGDGSGTNWNLAQHAKHALNTSAGTLFFDNAEFLQRHNDNSEVNLPQLYRSLVHFLAEVRINLQLVFVSSRQLDLPLPTLRLTYPNEPSLKEVVSEAFNDYISGSHYITEWFRKSIPDEYFRQDCIDCLSHHVVQVLSDSCKEYDVYVQIAKQYIDYIVDSHQIVENMTNSKSTLVGRTGSLTKLFLINPKFAFYKYQDVKNMIDTLRKESPNDDVV